MKLGISGRYLPFSGLQDVQRYVYRKIYDETADNMKYIIFILMW
jgi:hypothetical protein